MREKWVNYELYEKWYKMLYWQMIMILKLHVLIANSETNHVKVDRRDGEMAQKIVLSFYNTR